MKFFLQMIERLIKIEERQEKLQTSLESQQKYIEDLEEKLRGRHREICMYL